MRLLVRRKTASVISQREKNSKIEVKTQKIQELLFTIQISTSKTIKHIVTKIYRYTILDQIWQGEKSIDL